MTISSSLLSIFLILTNITIYNKRSDFYCNINNINDKSLWLNLDQRLNHYVFGLISFLSRLLSCLRLELTYKKCRLFFSTTVQYFLFEHFKCIMSPVNAKMFLLKGECCSIKPIMLFSLWTLSLAVLENARGDFIACVHYLAPADSSDDLDGSILCAQTKILSTSKWPIHSSVWLLLLSQHCSWWD